MPLPTAAKNEALDGLLFNKFSLHSAFPGTTGANELTGGGYTALAAVVNAASGGSRLLNAALTFTVPACTVRWVGGWNGTIFLDATPNGGSTPKNFTTAPTDYADKIFAPNHSYADTQTIVFYQGTPPAPLVEGTTYYVRDATTDTFKVAATSGGTAIPLTAPPSFGCVVSSITEAVYAAAATHTLAAFTATLPD